MTRRFLGARRVLSVRKLLGPANIFNYESR